MLKAHGDRMAPGGADEQKSAAESAVEGFRGRFGNCVPPVLEALGLAEVEHNARNNRMRAI